VQRPPAHPPRKRQSYHCMVWRAAEISQSFSPRPLAAFQRMPSRWH